ncbi:methyltransferase [Bacillus thuringiensis serovar pingluonsis]|uniref:Methyltransferase n=2 Tax=Bacillus TaxID=1386 RepID=A0A243AZR7_BACTU|nr:methyltransferase [Bacillus thuringiensis serovar pingluonsis]
MGTLIMENETNLSEVELRKNLIANINDCKTLLQLGEIYYSSGRYYLAANYLSYVMKMTNDAALYEKSNQLLFLAERAIQINNNDKMFSTFEFLDTLIMELLNCLKNHYYYNIDIELFELMRVRPSVDSIVVNTQNEKEEIVKHLQGLEELYFNLNDSFSKELLIKLLTFRLLGNHKVKMPLNTIDYWKQRKSIPNLIHSSETLQTNYHNWTLQLFDLTPLKYNLRLFYVPMGISATFLDKQYEYNKISPVIKVKEGDVVIDAGGCFGDTALYFAHEVGETGHVYTIEFIPSNLEIMSKNINLNEKLQNNITIVKHPLWNVSNTSLYYKDQGAASFVTFSEESGVTDKVSTITIDNLVVEHKLHKLDFIKMDIEGAEMNALKGAIHSITTFRPTLAIAIYHQISDFVNVMKFINDLNLGYQFYLGHYTVNAQETILFAVAREKMEVSDENEG